MRIRRWIEGGSGREGGNKNRSSRFCLRRVSVAATRSQSILQQIYFLLCVEYRETIVVFDLSRSRRRKTFASGFNARSLWQMLSGLWTSSLTCLYLLRPASRAAAILSLAARGCCIEIIDANPVSRVVCLHLPRVSRKNTDAPNIIW